MENRPSQTKLEFGRWRRLLHVPFTISDQFAAFHFNTGVLRFPKLYNILPQNFFLNKDG